LDGIELGAAEGSREKIKYRTPFGVCHGLGGIFHTEPTGIILLGRRSPKAKADPMYQIPRQPIALCPHWAESLAQSILVRTRGLGVGVGLHVWGQGTPCRIFSVQRRLPPAALPPKTPGPRPTCCNPPPGYQGRCRAAWMLEPHTAHARSNPPIYTPAHETPNNLLLEPRYVLFDPRAGHYHRPTNPHTRHRYTFFGTQLYHTTQFGPQKPGAGKNRSANPHTQDTKMPSTRNPTQVCNKNMIGTPLECNLGI
jgi:hypothetical protein